MTLKIPPLIRGGFGLPRKRLVPAGRIRFGPAGGLQDRLIQLASFIFAQKKPTGG
jgi:hypothetical protein